MPGITPAGATNPWIGGAQIAASILPGLLAHRKAKNNNQVDYQAITSRFMNMQPTGWFNPEDQQFVDRQVGSKTRQIGASTADARVMAARRYAARGLAGSPGMASANRRIDQMQLGANLDAAEGGQNMAYDLRNSREKYRMGLMSNAMGMEFAGADRNMERKNATNAAFWNSTSQLLPGLMDAFGGSKLGGFQVPTSKQTDNPNWYR
jgi:hypothetical protein